MRRTQYNYSILIVTHIKDLFVYTKSCFISPFYLLQSQLGTPGIAASCCKIYSHQD